MNIKGGFGSCDNVSVEDTHKYRLVSYLNVYYGMVKDWKLLLRIWIFSAIFLLLRVNTN